MDMVATRPFFFFFFSFFLACRPTGSVSVLQRGTPTDGQKIGQECAEVRTNDTTS
ncbi:hypothetical protein P170DRAFT_434328 [Aspergillus steynii IBT 23096]|uniref:Secreted protein n=1 Tax=Aspergillus steynii IBT 23096 TaxID=1392250 RepID=A0A2I2GIA9_9EURO|nr:uncharacterized protein P170DRAFT_434328 [Aspergillus steynii IBT 23096]PLB52613.1 hypothetical protein P170DRAFT_434328 [Aspergillus steynii IBT 23096]